MGKKKVHRKKTKKYDLRIKTLEKGWHDMDHVMVHAMFQCLVNYVENEMHQINWFDDSDDKIKEDNKSEFDCGFMNMEYVDSFRAAKKEIMELYNWWKEVNKSDYEEKNDPSKKLWDKLDHNLKLVNNGKFMDGIDEEEKKKWDEWCKAANKWENDFINKTTEMCERLVKIRSYLWS